MRTPSVPTSGWPLRTTAMSVVVPPMSATIPLPVPLSAQAPTTLAAGPESTVPTGSCRAFAMPISEPLPLTIISGASIRCAARIP